MAATFRIGQRVKEIAPPGRRGTVTLVQRTGKYSRVFVRIDGRGIVQFYPAQISFA